MISRRAFNIGLGILGTIFVFISTTAVFTLAAYNDGQPLWYGPASGAIITVGLGILLGLLVGLANLIWWFEQKYVKRPF